MGLLESLKKILDVDVDLTLIDQSTTISVTRGRAEEPISISSTGEDAIVDVNAIETEHHEQVKSAIRQARLETGELTAKDAFKEKQVARERGGQERIQETLSFFGPLVADEHLQALRAALILREAWEDEDRYIDQTEMREWRKDIREKHGPIAYPITNLCTAGYFDEGRYLRVLYEEMQESDDWKEGDYRRIFEEILENEPFTVFVSSADSVTRIRNQIVEKLRKSKKYDVDVEFVDVRGIGQNNIGTVKQAISRLDEEFGDIEYISGKKGKEIVVRIDADSFQEFDVD